MPEDNFLSALDARRPGLEQMEPSWRMIDDVLAGRIKRRGANGWFSPYFPKGRLEAEREYSLRVELTPFFPQTPQLLSSRLGALFRNKLQVEMPEGSGRNAEDSRGKWNQFLKEAGRRHASFEDLAVQAACLAQSHGFCAALIDRDPLPEDLINRTAGVSPAQIGEADLSGDARTPADRNVCTRPFDEVETTPGATKQQHEGRRDAGGPRSTGGQATSGTQISLAEAQARNLGRAFIALYSAPQILDWEFGSDGRLAWVKFAEQEMWRPRWDATPEPVTVYRIVDRVAITVYRARRDANGEWKVQAEAPVAHGFADTVPVVFLHPFPGNDGIGRPILQRAAEADIASARVLSDLVWDLFLLGNPILTFKTDRNDDELSRIGLGASRYIPLRNGKPGIENAEELKFVQLDPTGIELLFRAHSLFASQAQKQTGGGEEAAIPREQSGVAQAWRFKTGEERVLFMLARALEPFLTRCLELAGEAMGLSGDRTGGQATSGTQIHAPTVRMPESFDVAGTTESLETAEKLLELAAKTNQTELARIALQRIEGALGMLPGETRDALRREREGIAMAK